MHNERQRRLSDPFDMFGGFGNFRGSGGSIFGRNPFDDPFFTRPFGDMFGSNNFMCESPLVVPPSVPTIRELGSDDEEEEEMEDKGDESQDKGEEGRKSARAANEPFVDHPDDCESNEQANHLTDNKHAGATQDQSFKVHSCKVTYGGVDGVYYTSSATRRMGSDGMIMEDCKEADKRTGEATHRISRGLHDKGHSVVRKLNSNGKVDMSQMLHNLNKDELGSFEEAWKDNGVKHLSSGSSGGGKDRMSGWGSFLLQPTKNMGDARETRPRNDNVIDPSGGRTKKVVRIPIE